MSDTPRFDEARPRAGASFYKAHGLGNDYLVVEEGEDWAMSEDGVRRVCHRLEGLGGDGIVVLLAPATEPFGLRMFNPDGGEFERSGNGLRVLASWLERSGRIERGRRFEVEVGGDRIGMTVHDRSDEGIHDVSVDMGRARVGPDAVELDRGSLAGEAPPAHALLDVSGCGPLPLALVSVGNPHAVVFTDALDPDRFGGAVLDRELLERIGPGLTGHDAFTHGTNVQVASVPDQTPGHDPGKGDGERAPTGGGVVDALVWERGVGHTTASGTSACAVAVAAVESGRLSPGSVEVRMEGGSLFVDVGDDLDVVLRGPVAEVMTGHIADGMLRSLAPGS